MIPDTTKVLIVGGGPCGLMLANELGRRGVSAVVIDQKPATAFSPQANATQARTMEHYRRLGFANEIRALGLPQDYPTDIAYFTRYSGYEITRLAMPASSEATKLIKSMGGSWGAAELPHRMSQKFVEQVLLRHASALPNIAVNFGWRLTAFRDIGTGIDASITNVATGEERGIRALYLFGADGPRSFVRRQCGYDYVGEASAQRNFLGGRMHAICTRPTSIRPARIPRPGCTGPRAEVGGSAHDPRLQEEEANALETRRKSIGPRLPS
jgi:2-polyprenyl-6-methoxyphenol hydroxylase-like FAD-dependent oxidoreductase